MAWDHYKSLEYNTNQNNHPLIVLHGVLECKENWKRFCKKLQEKVVPEREIYALDLRNHGSSPRTTTHTYEDTAKDVLQFVQKLETGKVSLVGN